MKRILIIVPILVLFMFSVTEADIFRTLKLGSTGSDVRELQKMLNKDPDTRIASSGSGSLGQESTYFGKLTRLAVIKFQTKYAQDVLYSGGLYFPTGVVGLLTRTKLNKLYGLGLSDTNSSNSTNTSNPPHIDNISPSIINNPDQSITIYGSGFSTTSNTVVVASESDRGIGAFNSSDGKSITFSFTPSVVQKVKSQLWPYRNSPQYQSILSSFVQNLTGETISIEGGTTYVRAIILVRNAGGTSNPVNIKIDIKSLIK